MATFRFCMKIYTHDNDVIMSAMASQIASLTIFYSNFYTKTEIRDPGEYVPIPHHSIHCRYSSKIPLRWHCMTVIAPQIISDSSVSWTVRSGYPQKNLVTDRQSVSMSWRHLAMFLYAFAPSTVGGKGHQAGIYISWHVIGFCSSGNLQTLGISNESSVTKWHEHAFYIITITWHSFSTNDIHSQWRPGSPACSVFISW